MSEFFAIHHSRKNIKSLIILDVLMAMTLDPETGVKRETVFQDAYEIYLSFSRNANLANLCVLKTSFKDLILHPDYGIYILHMFAERYVSLQPVTQILVVFWMLQLKQLTRMIFILNTYWTKPSPLSKNSMLPRAILGDGFAVAQYCLWKHTIFDNGRGCVQISVLVLPLIF